MDDWLKWGELAAKFGSFAAIIVSGLIGWVVWSARREMVTQDQFNQFIKAHDEEHGALEQRLNDGDLRFAKLDETLKHLPTREDFNQLQVGMERLSGDIRVVTAVLKEVRTPVGLMVENAMSGGKP